MSKRRLKKQDKRRKPKTRPSKGAKQRLVRNLLLFGVLLVLALGIVATVALSRKGSSRKGGQSRPNIVLVTIDALRADRLSCYGYARPITPHLDLLAKRGVLFENAYSEAAFSGPSYASIFTGTYPHTHGVRDHPQELEDRNITLAEVLKETGYRTAGFYANGMIHQNYGQGFDVYSYRTDHEVVKASKEWLSEIQWEEPFFLWACVVAPHWRYLPPQPFMSRFVQPLNYQSKFMKDWADLYRREGVQGFDMMLRYRELGYTEEDAEHIRSRYDAEVAYADSLVEELVRFIEARGLMGERTILMVTSDHGESLGEHGLYFTHGIYLHDPVVHVPLLIHAPDRIPAGLRVSQVVRNIDVFPTLLALAGIPIPKEVEGVSLIPAIKGKDLHLAAFSENRPYVPELDRTPEHKHRYYIRGVRGKWKSVRKGNYFLVAIPHPEFVEYELYDVREVWKDSFSAPNRVNQLPKVFKDLQQELLQWDAKDAKKEVPLDRSEEAKEMLRSLGYL